MPACSDRWAPTPDVTREAWDATMATNLTSAFLGAKYQIPAMLARGKGSLIFVSSFVGYTAAMPGAATYAASKAGQIGLMKALAVEYGPQGIRVNALLPGGTQTAAADAMADTEEMKAFVRNMHALKRIAAPRSRPARHCSWHPMPRPSSPEARCWWMAACRSTRPEWPHHLSAISSQPSALTVTRSPASTTTVVVSASMIAGPASVWPGRRSSSA